MSKTQTKEAPIRTLQKGQLDKIYKEAYGITAAYNHKWIHTDTLWEVLHRARVKIKDKSKAAQKMKTDWNKLMDRLYETGYNYCRENDLDYRLPMIMLKEYIEFIKKNLG